MKYSDISREQRQAVRSLTDDTGIVIKEADKGSCVVVWERNVYLLEAEKQLSDIKLYTGVSNTKTIPGILCETGNKMFSSLKRRSFLQKSKSNILPIKKATNFGKPYLLY